MRTARSLNSDHAPTAEQLPPLDELAGAELHLGYSRDEVALRCRERQLIAALRENREIKAGTLCPVCTGHPVSDRQCICGGSGDAQDAYSGLLKDYLKLESNCAEKDAKIAELTRLLGDEHRADVIINEIVKKYMADAEAAEAKLRAVSDALDSDELEAHQLPSGDFYWAVDVDARDARIRAILEGK